MSLSLQTCTCVCSSSFHVQPARKLKALGFFCVLKWYLYLPKMVFVHRAHLGRSGCWSCQRRSDSCSCSDPIGYSQNIERTCSRLIVKNVKWLGVKTFKFYFIFFGRLTDLGLHDSPEAWSGFVGPSEETCDC